MASAERILIVIFAVLVAGCGSSGSTGSGTSGASADATTDAGGGSAGDGRGGGSGDTMGADAFGPPGFALPPPGTQSVYVLTRSDNSTFEAPASAAPDKDKGDGSWWRLDVGDFTKEKPEGFKAWLRYHDGKMEYLGADVYDGAGPGPAFGVTLETPVGGPLDGAVGTKAVTKGKGKMCFGTSCQDFDVEVSYEVKAKNAKVTVPYGTVQDVHHLHLATKSSDMGTFVLESDWYVKPGIGMLKAADPPGFLAMELKSLK